TAQVRDPGRAAKLARIAEMLADERAYLDKEERKDKARLRRGVRPDRVESKRVRRETAELPDVAGAVASMLNRPEGMPLEEYTSQVLSQHGEDGITIEVL